MRRGGSDGGFTVTELVVLIAVAALALAVFLLPTLARRRGCGNRTMRDAMQLRVLQQSLVTWAQNHADRYPLPSELDHDNTTVAELGAAKNHTANIFSPLVFHGLISTEVTLSPIEANPNIRWKEDYEFDRPKAAMDPDRAMWDPSFSADFTSPVGAHNSYAHMPPVGPRLELWANASAWSLGRPVLGNRGPEIATVTRRANGTEVPSLASPKSYTFLMHGTRAAWEGNIVFDDLHMEFISALRAGTYTNSQGETKQDYLFLDESDDPSGLNSYLGVFIRAGTERADYKPIWD